SKQRSKRAQQTSVDASGCHAVLSKRFGNARQLLCRFKLWNEENSPSAAQHQLHKQVGMLQTAKALQRSLQKGNDFAFQQASGCCGQPFGSIAAVAELCWLKLTCMIF